jgi:hypothetical protein
MRCVFPNALLLYRKNAAECTCGAGNHIARASQPAKSQHRPGTSHSSFPQLAHPTPHGGMMLPPSQPCGLGPLFDRIHMLRGILRHQNVFHCDGAAVGWRGQPRIVPFLRGDGQHRVVGPFYGPSPIKYQAQARKMNSHRIARLRSVNTWMLHRKGIHSQTMPSGVHRAFVFSREHTAIGFPATR